jgi:uncharacterized protein YggE
MFGSKQAISTPFGVTVFGSSTTRVPPDMASIRAAVSIVEENPGKAFSLSKSNARAVNRSHQF